MSAFTARSHHGHLLLDVPTDLPEGAVLELVPAGTWDDLDEAERVALESDLDASEEEFCGGRHAPLSDMVAVLRQQR